MKKYLLLLLLIRISCPAHAQSGAGNYPDSLKNVLKKQLPDTSRVKTLLLLSDHFSDKDTAVSLQYVRQAAALAKPGSYQEAMVEFYRAGAYFDIDFEKSKAAYMRAEQLFSKFKKKEALVFRSRAWHNFGALEQRLDNEKRYAEILIDHAIPLAQQAGDSARVVSNY